MCKEWILDHRTEDVRQLMLSASRWPDINMRAAVVQISAWQAARHKLPLWAANDDILYPEHISMEQCSSQATAQYKGLIISRLTPQQPLLLTDLTGGFGVDATMMARSSEDTRLTFVERNEELCRLARHNLPLLSISHADVICADSTDTLQTIAHQHVIFIDPARRDTHGARTYAISDCTPDVVTLHNQLLAHADWVVVKLSPMLDITEALRQLRQVVEVHAVSLDGECKELLFVMHATAPDTAAPTIHCVNIASATGNVQDFCFTPSDGDSSCPLAATPLRYLYEPNASVMKAAPFAALCQQFGITKLHPSSHLFTSDTPVADFPGRCFEVIETVNFNKKSLRPLLSSISQANITVRNFPLGAPQLRQRLRLRDGGSDYLFATTLADGSHVLVHCKK